MKASRKILRKNCPRTSRKVLSRKLLNGAGLREEPDQTIEQLITDLTAKIGEKIGVRRFSCFTAGEE